MTVATDPRIADLKRRIYAAAARQGYSEMEFRLEVYIHARFWRLRRALDEVRKLGVSARDLAAALQRNGEALAEARRRMEAVGAMWSRHEPLEYS